VEKKQRRAAALVQNRQAEIPHIDTFHVVPTVNRESLPQAGDGFIIGP
jgi:hypothetical protein